MKRNEFIKAVCTLGACSCAGAQLFAQNTESGSKDSSELKELKGKLDFMNKRFAKLIEIMDANLSEEAKKKILKDLGRACAREYISYAEKFKNDLKGFLADIQNQWVERAEYDKNNHTIKISGKKGDKCYCPFVKQGITPVDFCNCSIGWQKETYQTILVKPVDVIIEESILRGGERCSFTIRIS